MKQDLDAQGEGANVELDKGALYAKGVYAIVVDGEQEPTRDKIRKDAEHVVREHRHSFPDDLTTFASSTHALFAVAR